MSSNKAEISRENYNERSIPMFEKCGIEWNSMFCQQSLQQSQVRQRDSDEEDNQVPYEHQIRGH